MPEVFAFSKLQPMRISDEFGSFDSIQFPMPQMPFILDTNVTSKNFRLASLPIDAAIST